MHDLTLKQMPRFEKLPESPPMREEAALLLPRSCAISYDPIKCVVSTNGLGLLDNKRKDLIEIVSVEEAGSCVYRKLNVFGPRTYVESIYPVPQHVVVQSILTIRVSAVVREAIESLMRENPYGKTAYDSVWITPTPLSCLHDGDRLMIMGRRVGGWDGSLERPVIELLAAGGHVPAIWNECTNSFESLSEEQALEKELIEEIGLTTDDVLIKKIGGFHNRVTSELVILYTAELGVRQLLSAFDTAIGNTEHDVDGLYIGSLLEVMTEYRCRPTDFAGGAAAAPTNFPSDAMLMKKLLSVDPI